MLTRPNDPAPSVPPAGRGIAILIGINEYQDGIPKLRNAVRDVQTVAQVLGDEHGYEVRLLLDQQATLAGLRGLFSSLPRELSADIRLIIYFAGHGIAGESAADAASPQGFLIPQDAKRDDPATLLPMIEVQSLLSELPCKHLLLFLDCCFAGAFRWSQTRSLRVRPATLFRERYERYLRDAAWQVMASAASDERALDVLAGSTLGRRGADADNSPFAAALCRGLRGAADLRIDGQPGDGVIVANELHLYLESAFERLEQQLKRAVQKPLLWSLDGRDKGQFIFFTPGRSMLLPSALELSEENNPYRGLEPYDEKNAALFFGRIEVTQQLEKQVIAQPLTVVSGVSGSGKSSVVRAGLLSRLRRAAGWCILPLVRPGTQPLMALAPVLGELGSSAPIDLVSAVSAWRVQNPNRRLLLVIDQLEELVTMGASEDEQEQFLQSILRALAEGHGALHVLMTLRSDFEPHFAELLTAKHETPVRFVVRPLNRQELRQVIDGPASERVLYFEPASLVDQIVDEVAEMPGALPLLSFTMSELYRSYVRSGRSDRCLTSADYQKLGGVTGALSQRADEALRQLDAAHKDTLRRVMLRMVALEAGEVARRRVPLAELRYGDGHPEEPRVKKVLQRMQEARLVVAGTDSDGAPYAEPAHDKLVLGWPQLWSFIKEEQNTIPLHRLLTQEAAAWARAKRDSEHLWSGNPRLPLVIDLQQKTPLQFNALEGDFIQTSERHRRRLRGLLIAGVGTVIAVLTGLTVFAFDSRSKAQMQTKIAMDARGRAEQQQKLAREAQEKEREQKERAEEKTREAMAQRARAEKEQARAEEQTRRADAESLEIKQQLLATYVEQGRQLLLAGDNPAHALLWLHRAQREGSNDPMLPLLLHDAMRIVDGVSAVLVGHTKGVFSAAYSPDGRRILTASADRTAKIWEADSGRFVYELPQQGLSSMAATYSPDGLRIAAWANGVSVGLWDASSGHFLGTLKHPPASSLIFVNHGTGRLLFESALFTAELEGSSMAYTPDGRRIVTVSAGGGNAELWDTESGLHLAKLVGAGSRVHRGAISPDGRRVVTGGIHGTAFVYETDTGRRVLELKGHKDRVNCVTYSPDGQRILTASKDHTARLWEADTGKLVSEFTGHGDSVHVATYSPDGRYIATASDDRTVRIWEAGAGRLVKELKGHGDRVWDVAYSPDGKRLVTASADRSARVFDADSGEFLARLSGHADVVYRAAFSPDSQRVVTASEDKTARVFALGSTRLTAQIIAPWSDAWLKRYHPDSRHFAMVHGDRIVRVWEANSARLTAELSGHTGPIHDLAYSPDGLRLVTASDDRTARIWDARSGRPISVLTGHGSAVTSVVYSRDGRRIATNANDRTVRIWDADSGRLIVELTGHAGPIRHIVWSPDSRHLVTAEKDESVKLWDASSGHLAGDLRGHKDEVWTIWFSHDGHRIITSDRQHIRIWNKDSSELITSIPISYGWLRSPDRRKLVVYGYGPPYAEIRELATGRTLITLKGHEDWVLHAGYSPDGRHLVTASMDRSARLWEAHTGRLLAQLRGHMDYVTGATFSPDGRYLITKSSEADHTARIWEVGTGRLVAILPVPYQEMEPIFGPNGDTVVMAGDEKTLRVWELTTGRLLAVLRGEPAAITAVAYSPDGSRLFSTSKQGTVRVWDVSRETRSAEEIGKLLRCRLAFRFEREGSSTIVANTPNPSACTGMTVR